MKGIALGLAVLLVSVATFAQESSPKWVKIPRQWSVTQMQQGPSAPRTLNVWVKVQPTVATNGIVAGTTNLPDGTVLSLSLAGPDYSAFNRDNCCFDAVVAVSHGAFGPVKIIKDGVDPKPGSYRVMVVMRDESMQPANVLAVIGKQGENLQGPFVVGPSNDRGVEATIPVEVR